MDSATHRKALRKEHFAFIRAIAQGVDPLKSWELYLRQESESIDARKVKTAIAWIRSEFAAAARRHARPGLARLILIDAAQIKDLKLPSLDEFAQAEGLEDFSAAEIQQSYLDAFGRAATRAQRRTQLVLRQLDAIAWLEAAISPRPRPGDPVGDWLAPALASRLLAAGMPTLFTVAERINSRGARWWAGIPAIGAGKAATVVKFFLEHEASLGMPIGDYARQPASALSAAQRDALVPAATALVPIEKLRLPAALDGAAGRFRAPSQYCTVQATNDLEAINEWLRIKGGGAQSDDAETNQTHRAYRKEAERLLLWSLLEAGKALSSLDTSDAARYAEFIASPPAHWCGLRQNRRWSPLWRPFEGPLAPSAQRLTLRVLRSLFSFLREQNYLVANPFSALRQPPMSLPLGSTRALSHHQWQVISAALDECPDSELARRRARAIRWFYATGLRLSELGNATCGDLRRVSVIDARRKTVQGVTLSVRGKGDKTRDVPIPQALILDLSSELARFGFPADVTDPANHPVPILARFRAAVPGEPPPGWSDSGISKSVHRFMQRCASSLTGDDRRQVLKASTHWLRHTHASHALNGQDGVADSAMPIPLVRQTLGHSSLATTSAYIQADQAQHIQAMERFWEQNLQVGQ